MSSTSFQFKRYDLSEDRSLRAWSAADELLVSSSTETDLTSKTIGIYGDRFGYLSCNLSAYQPLVVTTNKSQELAITANLKANQLPETEFFHPSESLNNPLNVVFIKMPKSIDLFQLYLAHTSANSNDEVQVTCGFMTRHFTKSWIKIAEAYFEDVTQSRAVKKARVLSLKGKKKDVPTLELKSIAFNGQEYKQYGGVFSSNHIDYATQYFLQHVDVSSTPNTLLDLASGNGVIGSEIHKKCPDATVHLLDDSYLAVASAKLNVVGDKINHHYQGDVSNFESEMFDMIVSNPPFHFEHDINIQIPLTLFKGCHRILKSGGNFQLVGNTHLNYKVHLEKLFARVNILAQDEKFVVYQCVK